MKLRSVKIAKSAQNELDSLDDKVWHEAMKALRELDEDPLPATSSPLRGHANLYRLRFHPDYRIVYQYSQKQRKAIVTRVRRRMDVYRGL